MAAKDRIKFGPSSEKQRLVLLENEVDIHLTGGGEHCASTLKTVL